MRGWHTLYESFANLVCRSLVALVDVRLHKRVRRLSADERQFIASIVRPGDILVDSNDAFPGWQILSKIFLGSEWVHMGLYVGDGIVVDAGQKAHVSEITLQRFLRTSRVAVLRPHYQDDEDVERVIACARKFIGKRYNSALDLASADDVYCTQMMREVLKTLQNPIEVRTTNVLGRSIVSPDAFVYNDRITVVFKTHLSGAVSEMADLPA